MCKLGPNIKRSIFCGVKGPACGWTCPQPLWWLTPQVLNSLSLWSILHEKCMLLSLANCFQSDKFILQNILVRLVEVYQLHVTIESLKSCKHSSGDSSGFCPIFQCHIVIDLLVQYAECRLEVKCRLKGKADCRLQTFQVHKMLSLLLLRTKQLLTGKA